VERLRDGLPAPAVPEALMASVQAEVLVLTPSGTAPAVVADALGPADAAAAVGLADEFARLQLHGVTDTVVTRDDILEIAARVADGLEVGAAAEAVDALARHDALRPGLVTVAMDAVLAGSDVETRAGEAAAVIRELSEVELPVGVMREAVRGALNGRVEGTRRALWLMRRFRVTNLAWLYRWRIAEGVRRYQEQEKAASERSARLTAAVGGVRDDG
jgi:predicted metal-dependent phosphoesterase TrpH